MNKADLVEAVRSAADLTRGQAESAVGAMVDGVVSAVKKGERVTVAGFGSFNPSSRAARTGRNPQTGEPVRIAASKGVRFAPAGAFKQSLHQEALAKGGRAMAPPAKKAPSKKATSQAGKTLAKKGVKKASKKQAAKTLGRKGQAARKR